MFNDKYGLTEAVLSGRKTMTRRIIPPIEINWARRGKVTLPVSGYRHRTLWIDCRQFLPDSSPFDYVAPQKYQPAYDFDEEVAVAQSYQTLIEQGYLADDRKDGWVNEKYITSPGYRNKMFVRADLMPHRIRITDIKVEKLQNISIEDCEKEGIIRVNWRQYLKQDIDDFIPQPYKDHHLWTLPIFEESFIDSWAEQKEGEFAATSADVAFAVLIDNISGKGTWMRNPWVFAYEFELTR